jgi:uncharacterized membrane protein
VKTLLKSLIGIGSLLFIGTAGASDLGNISLGQIFLQIFIAVILIALGYLGLEYIKPRQRRIIKINRHHEPKLKQVA